MAMSGKEFNEQCMSIGGESDGNNCTIPFDGATVVMNRFNVIRPNLEQQEQYFINQVVGLRNEILLNDLKESAEDINEKLRNGRLRPEGMLDFEIGGQASIPLTFDFEKWAYADALHLKPTEDENAAIYKAVKDYIKEHVTESVED